MNIRLERPQDYREVENLTREAFWLEELTLHNQRDLDYQRASLSQSHA